MIRKSLIALAALTAMGAAALAPTSASAWGKHHHWHGGWGFGLGIVDVAPVSDCYLVQKMTRSGYVKTIRVCD